jgi:hypothetical protein
VDRRSLSIAAIIKTAPQCIPVPISARGTIGNCLKINVSNQGLVGATTIAWDGGEARRLIVTMSNAAVVVTVSRRWPLTHETP